MQPIWPGYINFSCKSSSAPGIFLIHFVSSSDAPQEIGQRAQPTEEELADTEITHLDVD